MMLTHARFASAVAFLYEHTGDQSRELSRASYTVHPVTMAIRISRWFDDDVVIATLLHDLVEDHPDRVTPTLIETTFGERVRFLVTSVSIDPTKPAEDERVARLARMADSLEVTALVLVDNVDNIADIKRHLDTLGLEAFHRLNLDPHVSIRRSRDIVTRASEWANHSGIATLVTELKGLVNEVEIIVETLRSRHRMPTPTTPPSVLSA